ncbi:MAG: helix-turn-helix transcriptional regulator [Streptosporangiaceae bacterium]
MATAFNHRVLRAWRLGSGLTPEQVCVAAKVSYPYLRTLEDKGGNPSAALLARLAEVYGRSLDELFDTARAAS